MKDFLFCMKIKTKQIIYMKLITNIQNKIETYVPKSLCLSSKTCKSK